MPLYYWGQLLSGSFSKPEAVIYRTHPDLKPSAVELAHQWAQLFGVGAKIATPSKSVDLQVKASLLQPIVKGPPRRMPEATDWEVLEGVPCLGGGNVVLWNKHLRIFTHCGWRVSKAGKTKLALEVLGKYAGVLGYNLR